LDDLRKRILNEIFVAPSVVLPISGGGTAWLLSWALGGVASLNLVGLVGVMVGIGWFATRFIFQLDSITEKAMRDQIASRLREEEKKLDELDQKLYADRDQRPRDYLMLLRTNRAELEKIAQTPGIQIRSMEIVKQARQLFWAATEQLEQAHRLSQLATRLMGDEKQRVLEQREGCLKESKESVEHLRSAVATFRQFVEQEQERDMDTLQKDLEQSLQSARRSEERMREWAPSSDEASYLRE
jgi:hypothetical protein